MPVIRRRPRHRAARAPPAPPRGVTGAQRRLTALPVPGQNVGQGHLQRSRGQPRRPGARRTALLCRPLRPDEREHRRPSGGRHRNDLGLGARQPRTGLDEPAEGGRLLRPHRVERAGTRVNEQPHHQTGQVPRVDELHRLSGVGGQCHPAAAGGPAYPVRDGVRRVVRPGHPSRPHERRPCAVPGHHIVLAGHLERAVGVLAELLGVPYWRTARGVLGRPRPHPLALVHRMAGDEQIPPGPVPQRVHRLPHMARHIAADIHDRVPTALAQGPVVAGVPVTEEPGHPGEQLRPGLSPAEQRHLGAGAQRLVHNGAAHE